MCWVVPFVANAGCKGKIVTESEIDTSRDQYLYVTLNGVTKLYECGSGRDKCDSNSWVVISNIAQYEHKKKDGDFVVYRCMGDTSIDPRWKSVNPKKQFGRCGEKSTGAAFANPTKNVWAPNDVVLYCPKGSVWDGGYVAANYCVVTGQKDACWVLNDDDYKKAEICFFRKNTIWNHDKLKCECKPGYEKVDDTNNCYPIKKESVQNAQPVAETVDTTPTQNTTDSKTVSTTQSTGTTAKKTVEQQCREYNGDVECSPERLECFKKGSATKWVNGNCECTDKNKTWEYKNNSGQCVKKKKSDQNQNTNSQTEDTVNKDPELTGGCKLTFNDGTVLNNIDSATWYLNDGSAYIKITDGHYADDKPLEKLTKINGETVNLVIPDANKVYTVYFRCEPWDNGEYFAFWCKYGYDKKSTKIGMNGATALYDKCGIPDGGCKLEFSDGTVLNNIDNATWHLDDGSAYIKTTDGHYADDKPLEKLTKINGETVNLVIPDANKVYTVYFRCEPWDNGEYFAFWCKYGYDKKSTKIGMNDATALYDKCIETSGDDEFDEDDDYDTDDDAEVEAAKLVLKKFFDNASNDNNKSVWKNAEGKFNTARLASDLTAGVVLGTVGGVVSGVVIKKKQVKKGFDALHCTVGGQPVADWGDLFNVGLRK